MCQNCTCETCRPRQPITGKVKLHNGLVLKWLRFVDAALTTAAAEAEAIRIVTAQHVHVARCWAE